jgi:hypothetical protein
MFAVNATIQTEHILYLLPDANLERLCQREGDGTINAFYYLQWQFQEPRKISPILICYNKIVYSFIT